jgi:hypothetical protein
VPGKLTGGRETALRAPGAPTLILAARLESGLADGFTERSVVAARQGVSLPAQPAGKLRGLKVTSCDDLRSSGRAAV